MSDEQTMQIQKLSAALEVSGNTIRSLEKRVKDAQQIISILESEKKAWSEQKVLQEKIIQQQLQSGDSKTRELEKEIIELKRRLKISKVAD
jgi:hypothetical protein